MASLAPISASLHPPPHQLAPVEYEGSRLTSPPHSPRLLPPLGARTMVFLGHSPRQEQFVIFYVIKNTANS